MVTLTRRTVAITATALALATLVLPAGPAQADSIRARQWHLADLDISTVHTISQGAGVTVALIDTGVADHRDLSGAVLPGTSEIPGRTDDGRRDVNGHGTELAGLIAGHGHGSHDGVFGIAPKAKILPIGAPVAGGLNSDAISAAVDFAIAHHAGVVNMSFGMAPDDTLHQAILKAQAANIVVVASAGNNGQVTGGSYPGAYPEVLTVGAYGKNDKIAPLSVTGPQVDLAAPGMQMVTTGDDGGYREVDGTSAAAAVVSGAAALLRAKYPDLNAAEIVHRLTATATDAGAKGRDDSYGYGRLNIVKALTADVKPLPSAAPPSAAPSDPGTTAQGSDDSGNSGLITAVVAVIAVLIVAVIVFAVIFVRRGHSTP